MHTEQGTVRGREDECPMAKLQARAGQLPGRPHQGHLERSKSESPEEVTNCHPGKIVMVSDY